MGKAELLKLLISRGIDVESPKVESELIENTDFETHEVCIPTWDEDSILTKASLARPPPFRLSELTQCF
jgi:hypothetical protein